MVDTILFLFPREKPYNSHSVRSLPCGGTEKTVIFLGEALQSLGYTVSWATTLEEIATALQSCNPDIVITQEAQLFERFPDSKRVWWTHHYSDQPVIQRNVAYARAFSDHIITLSQAHHGDFKDKLRLESRIIGHGVWMNEVETGIRKEPRRYIYASAPYRGLERISKLFKEIREKEPIATIAICSSMETYGTPEEDLKYQALFDELASIEGVELLGALNQHELYKQYARASVLLYPCTWKETYCLALDEARAHGCESRVLADADHAGALLEERPLRDWLDVAKQWEQLWV